MGQRESGRSERGGWVGGSGPEGSQVAHLGENLGENLGANLGKISVRISVISRWMKTASRDQDDVGVVVTFADQNS